MKSLPGIFLAVFALLTACRNESADKAVPETQATAEAAPAVALWRLDCGTIHAGDLNAFSDADVYAGRSIELVNSCYLVRHGDEYMLWDAGLPASLRGHEIDESADMDATIRTTIAAQLAALGLTPDRIDRVAVSHYHFDHIGQLPAFPGATLLIGALDWDVITGGDLPEGADPTPFAPWIKDGGAVEPVSGDYDVFGDGSVVMLATPGHTPGHHSLLVRLHRQGPMLLTGDLAHFQENYENNGVPDFNTDHDRTVASLGRFKRLADETGAAVIIQHEPADIGKLPAFPEPAN